MPINLTQTPKQILVSLINQDNGTALSEEMLVFGTPATHSGAKNTSIVATAAPDMGYTGSVTFNYNRLNIANIPGTRSKVFSQGTNVNISDLIPLINSRYQINLTANDFTQALLPTFTLQTPNQLLDFVLTIKSTSLIYYGSVTLQLRRADINLNTIITNTNLPDLTF